MELLHNRGDNVDMSYIAVVHAMTQQKKDRLQCLCSATDVNECFSLNVISAVYT